MRITDLNNPELLEVDPDGGMIRFAGERAIVVDAVAMGLLRKYLVENFGFTAARTVLTRFGFAHGWRMAESIRDRFEWEDDESWRRAGCRLHTLEGLFRALPGCDDALAVEGSVLVESYEAEQHLLQFGRAEVPVCWTISGLISGYLSRTEGQETYVIEDRCLARGDAACHLKARTQEKWGQERTEDLAVYSTERLQECLDVSLNQVITTLKETEAKLHSRRRQLVQVASEEDAPDGIVAKSRVMRQTVELARRVAAVDSTVLITGESGAGKERIARLIHESSPRSTGPFIAVNCGAITDTLLESELFGHIRGSFTGAAHDRPGLFEAANRGTLLLDEIGDVSPDMQVKLLRVLQEHEVRRVGDNKSRVVDVRVLAATNRDLVQRITEGLFRRDLYYRIKVVDIAVPALRERRADILVLARLLLSDMALRLKRPVTGITPEAADQILRYEWPGNVRELENAMERAVVFARGNRVELADLPEEVRHALPRPLILGDQVRPLKEISKEYILAALEVNGGSQARTAEQLGIGTATLYRKLKSYGVQPAKDRPHTDASEA
jgi:two-component system, NtrC family, response regulator HydG